MRNLNLIGSETRYGTQNANVSNRVQLADEYFTVGNLVPRGFNPATQLHSASSEPLRRHPTR